MVTIITFIIVLGIMVLVHEFGHFVMAKRFGVKVLEFSLGMGPRIIGKKWGKTEYSIKAFPIGGSVRMLGESYGETEEKIAPEDIGRSYWEQSPGKRIGITAAGPFLNIVMAILLAPAIFMIGIEVPSYMTDPPVVQGIEPGGPADQAGFQIGDEITAINGKRYKTWEDAESFFILNPSTTVNVTVKRGSDTTEIPLKIGADEKRGNGISGFDPAETTVVGMFSKNSPAKAAGMQDKDRIISIAGKPVKAFSQMRKIIQEAAPGSFPLEVMRDGKVISLSVKPELIEDESGKRFVIGVAPYMPAKFVRYGPIMAIKEGVFLIGAFTVGNFQALGKLVTGKLGMKSLGGPVEIGFIVGTARRMGMAYLLRVTVFISLVLGIMNFFPIPALDGGHIMFALMEIIGRRKLNRKVVDILNTVGFASLMGLIFLITVQDIFRNKEAILQFFRPG